tara:strand:- start:472 stop:987 length:516 start_codon:yes stop_codon:yes gene_type:complete
MRFLFVNIIIFFLFTNFSEADNIRFIDVNYIVNNSISGKNLNQIIEKKNKKITSELKILSKKLEEQKNKIVSQKNILKKEDLDNLIIVHDNEVKKFNEIRKKMRNEFNSFNIKSKKKIIDLLNPLITNYLKKESIQMLLQKDKIVFGSDTLDITKEILKLFDDKHKKIQFE